jgi:murein DD-endopeptidase MepM/ murein hydrolase activator NlpD
MDIDSEIASLLKETKKLNQQETISGNNLFEAPIHGTWYNSGGFTYQPNPTHPTGHPAVDMRAVTGTPIYAFTNGIVTLIGDSSLGGNFISIDHANGLSTYYAHCSTVNVHKGDKVTKDTIIGTVGNTGSAKNTFPHLHFEIHDNGKKIDPTKYFSIPKYSDPKNNPEEPLFENYFLNDEAKQNNKAFNMAQHKKQAKTAYINTLITIIDKYGSL